MPMGPFMISATTKLLSEVALLAGAISLFAMNKDAAGMLLIGCIVGSVAPVAVRNKQDKE